MSISAEVMSTSADVMSISAVRVSGVRRVLGVLLLLLGLGVCEIPHFSKKQIDDYIGKTKIMYGAAIRLKSVPVPYYLHSHTVNYPRGSNQQSVTGFYNDNDYNSLWTIKEAHQDTVKTYYHELLCGDSIRLEHALTHANLHSEEIYQSMITGGQEVSAYGQHGHGDQNDNWILSCMDKKAGEQFYGEDLFELVHENTEKKLRLTKFYEYRYDNWENIPFEGQVEVSAVAKSTRETQFKIVGGIFFKESHTEVQSQREEDL